jgi:hypothetical protein
MTEREDSDGRVGGANEREFDRGYCEFPQIYWN